MAVCLHNEVVGSKKKDETTTGPGFQ